MKKIILATIALSLMSVQFAFAENLGTLSNNAQPQRLIPASEFTRFLADHHEGNISSTNNLDSNKIASGKKSNLWYGYGSYGGYSPYSYYGYGSYYPSYGYGYGSYGYPYYGYGYGYWLDGDSHSNTSAVTHNRANLNSEHPFANAAHVPVVCFASDSQGTWFGAVDLASNVERTQNSVNRECSSAGGSCVQNLGCALAVDSQE